MQPSLTIPPVILSQIPIPDQKDFLNHYIPGWNQPHASLANKLAVAAILRAISKSTPNQHSAADINAYVDGIVKEVCGKIALTPSLWDYAQLVPMPPPIINPPHHYPATLDLFADHTNIRRVLGFMMSVAGADAAVLKQFAERLG